MENCSFQTQLVSIMEILAKAALAEINRRVDDSCAVLRLEITQSQRDIDVLKKKYELMEGELRRTRMRTRRKGFYPPAAERYPPLVKIVLNKERETPVWDQDMAVEEDVQPPQCAAMEPAAEDEEPILIKEESAEEDVWKNDAQEQLTSGAVQTPCFEDTDQTEGFVDHYQSSDTPTTAASLLPSEEDAYHTFTEPPASESPDGVELIVKQEAEANKSAALIGSDHRFVMDEADRQLWPSSQGRDAGGDPGFSYAAAEQYQQNPSIFACQLPLTHGAPVEDLGLPLLHSAGKAHPNAIGALRAKRRARAFGCRRAQAAAHAMPVDEAHGMLAQINAMGESSLVPQPLQHQYRDTEPNVRGGNEGLVVSNLATSSSSSSSGFSRNSFSLVRRMRTPWRPGVGEKRFSCTYCTKSFVRFSQLKEHLRSHTGEKPFSCLQCGRSFTKQCNLIRHAVVHSGEKPYQCAQCGKCFTQRSSLKSHQKTAH